MPTSKIDIMLDPQAHGYMECKNCNGYGSSLKEEADRCSICNGLGLVKDPGFNLFAYLNLETRLLVDLNENVLDHRPCADEQEAGERCAAQGREYAGSYAPGNATACIKEAQTQVEDDLDSSIAL
jgi:hypothetical protein